MYRQNSSEEQKTPSLVSHEGKLRPRVVTCSRKEGLVHTEGDLNMRPLQNPME